jgi:carbon-monoxide dehydrogenase large subunit
MEATIGYRPAPDSGTFSYAAHAALVAVDPEVGDVEILDYVIVEDGGKLVNPMIVDGQIFGGLAQGIGTALYEEMPFDSAGQPLASTFADYLLPGPTEVPAPRVEHMETLAPHTEFGVKGSFPCRSRISIFSSMSRGSRIVRYIDRNWSGVSS